MFYYYHYCHVLIKYINRYNIYIYIYLYICIVICQFGEEIPRLMALVGGVSASDLGNKARHFALRRAKPP